MRYFDAETTSNLLDYPRLIRALREAHAQGSMVQNQCTIIEDKKNKKNSFISQFSWDSSHSIAIKLNSIFPDNVALSPPQPSIQGLVILFEGKTGKAIAACDGAALTFHKTAADSALAADYLSRKQAKTLLIVGAGGLAPHVIEAMRCVRPCLNKVLIWNRTLAKAETLAAALSSLNCPHLAVPHLDEAAAQADIISCITMSKEPLLRGSSLKPGCHVDLIGAYQPSMREADDEVIRRAERLFVDTYTNCESSGDVGAPLASGILTRDQIVADLFALCKRQHKGREAETEITVFKNVGGGHLDMFTIKHLLAMAEH